VEIRKHLKGIDFPARKQDLIEPARKNGAAEDVVSVLEEIEDQEFHAAADVGKAIGEAE
jgi:hypothetical protein